MRIWILAVCIPGVAAAEPRLELGAAIGGHAFSSDVELGVDDRMDEPGPTSGAALGLRLGYALGGRLAIEGEAMIVPTEDDVLGDAATVIGLRAHARVDVARLVGGKLRLFVV